MSLELPNDDDNHNNGNRSANVNDINNPNLREPLLIEKSGAPQQSEVSVLEGGGESNPGDDTFVDEGGDNSSQQQPQPHLIDGIPYKTSLILKTLWFLSGLSGTAWGRYSAIYYNIHGLDSLDVGLIEGLLPVVRSICQPLWGIVADRYRVRKKVYLLTKAMNTSLLMMLALKVVYESKVLIYVVSLCSVMFVSSGVLDSYTLDLLKDRTLYGRYRMWCAVSWGLGSMTMGLITDHFGFNWNFILFGTLGFLSFCMIALVIPDTQATSDNDDDDDEETNVGDNNDDGSSLYDLLCLFLRPRVLIFVMELAILGASMATVERLLFLYMVNDLQSSTFLCGLTVGVTVLFELPIFWHAKPLLERVGHDGMFTISMFFFIVRVFGYTLLTPSTRYWILCLELLHGLTFACFWVATMDISKILSQVVRGRWNTAIPMIVSALYYSIGAGVGSIVGGYCMHQFGSKVMYRGVVCIMCVMFVVHVSGCLWVRVCYGRNQSFLPCFDTSATTVHAEAEITEHDSVNIEVQQEKDKTN